MNQIIVILAKTNGLFPGHIRVDTFNERSVNSRASNGELEFAGEFDFVLGR